jgi:hypothetical protein
VYAGSGECLKQIRLGHFLSFVQSFVWVWVWVFLNSPHHEAPEKRDETNKKQGKPHTGFLSFVDFLFLYKRFPAGLFKKNIMWCF